MSNGTLAAIFICPHARGPMQEVQEVMALAGKGLEGDRYATGEGSYSKGIIGKRQVTLMNTRFFARSNFTYGESRRNLFVHGTDLIWLAEKRVFTIGETAMRGLKYCDPCMIPSKLSGKPARFMDEFQDCGGLIAEVLEDGLIRVNDELIPPPRKY